MSLAWKYSNVYLVQYKWNYGSTSLPIGSPCSQGETSSPRELVLVPLEKLYGILINSIYNLENI